MKPKVIREVKTKDRKARLFKEPQPIQFLSAGKFQEWLDSHVEFSGSSLLDVHLDPPHLNIGFDTVPSFQANDVRKIRSFTIYPEGPDIDLTSLYALFETGPSEIFVDSIETSVDDEKIVLRLRLLGGAEVVILADSYCIEENPILRERRLPWISESELYAEFTTTQFPKPAFWIEALSALGHDVCFRYCWGAEKNVDEVPYPEYAGWFLQYRNRILEHAEGIFFFHVKQTGNVGALHLVNRDPFLTKLWNDLGRVVGDLPRVRVSTGNCDFTGKEWKTFLTTGALPKKLQPK